MREDIVGGIRNALEHGASIEQAMRSFISAGYSEAEVMDAARDFSGAGSIVYSQSVMTQQKSQMQQNVSQQQNTQMIGSNISQTNQRDNLSQASVNSLPAPQQIPASRPMPSPLPVQQRMPLPQQSGNYYSPSPPIKRSGKGAVIFLVIILVLLIGGLVGALLFPDKIVEILNKI